ncbi:acyl carrier protein [Streptomyces sp. NPDC018833]|uniref:acyl carrier protein n=1 Tax=Streptomyces sp. NPDC018833 TaxID=3365053 RepID=UPI0037B0B1EC
MMESGQRTDVDMRQVVRAVWEQVLGHADFGDDDRFFTLPGGHSLTAVQVVVALSKELDAKLPVRLIMRHRTVNELAAAITEQVGA